MNRITSRWAVCLVVVSIGAAVAAVMAGDKGASSIGGSSVNRGIEAGACCFADGSCMDDTTESACINSGGEWQGPSSFCLGSGRGSGIRCFPRGACCLDNYNCVDDVTQDYCEGELQGVWHGPGSYCLDVRDGGDPSNAALQGAVTCLEAPNDDCENAILISSFEGMIVGSTAGATMDDIQPCADPDSFLLPGVWYKLTGNGHALVLTLCRGVLRGKTTGELNVYCGSCDHLNCVTGDAGIVEPCFYDALREPEGDGVSVSWCAGDGVEYFIQVMYPSESGEFGLQIHQSELCKAGPCGPQNDFCEDAPPICPGIIYTGDTYTATNDYLDHGAPINTVFFCGSLLALYDVWYSYTPAESGLLFVHVEQLPTEWVFGVYDDCPEEGGHLLNCNFTRHHGVIVVPVDAYHTYYIRIAGFLESRGEYIMNILGPPCADDEPYDTSHLTQ